METTIIWVILGTCAIHARQRFQLQRVASQGSGECGACFDAVRWTRQKQSIVIPDLWVTTSLQRHVGLLALRILQRSSMLHQISDAGPVTNSSTSNVALDSHTANALCMLGYEACEISCCSQLLKELGVSYLQQTPKFA